MGETPLEGNCLANPYILVGTSRGPLVLADDECLRNVDNLCARGHSGLHCKGVEERLHRGTYLTLALTDIVVLEISVVRAPDIGLDMACDRFNCHKAGPEN